MAGSAKAELASNSLDGSTFSTSYSTGARLFSGGSLDRSGSFPESVENRTMASEPNGSRNSAFSADIASPSQHLMLDSISMGDQRYTRAGELRRVLGISLEEHSFGSVQSKPVLPIASKELKRFKASLLYSSTRARDRAKHLNESILKLDTYRNLLLWKQQRNETPSGEKLGGSSLLKMENQIHQNSLELVSQRLEDRTKNTFANKCVHSSMAELEGHSAGPSRQGTLMEKDKSVSIEKEKSFLRIANGSPFTSEDKIHGLSAGGDGWDKKMKRKCSVGMMVNRVMDAKQDPKLAIQQRPNSETHAQSFEGTSFRSSSFNGIIGSGKMDVNSQLSGGGSRAILRNDVDIGSLPNERRERSPGPEKDRVMPKGNNKLNIREDSQMGSQNNLTKGKASRAPRTGVVISSSSNFSRSLGSIDGWEQPPLNKVQSLSGAVNRKRSLPTGSALPPVAQWVCQQPQKISRTRRANVVCPVSNFDEAHILTENPIGADVGTQLTALDSPGGSISRGITNGTQQLKLKFENVPSPAGFSESEDSGAMDNKSKEKEIDNSEMENGFLNPVNRASATVFPSKKNKASMKEDIGDGSQSHGKTGRSSVPPKACLPLVKVRAEIGETNKLLRKRRPGSDKAESRVGRPPSKKVSERKVYGHRSQILNSISSDLTGELNDDREELLVAANAAQNATYDACSSFFWKKMAPLFSSVNPEDINYVQQQISFVEQLDESLSTVEHKAKEESVCAEMPLPPFLYMEPQGSEISMVGSDKEVPGRSSDALAIKKPAKSETQEWFEKIVPLSQRLLSAFVVKDEMEKFDFHIEQRNPVYQYSNNFKAKRCVEEEHKGPDLISFEFKVEMDFDNQKSSSRNSIFCNGYVATSKSGNLNFKNAIFSDELAHENGVLTHSGNQSFVDRPQTCINQLQNFGACFSDVPNGCHYEDMALNERLLMELHSIDLYPETVPDLAEGEEDEIEKNIAELKLKLCEQVRNRKRLLHRLEKALQDAKEKEKRNVEQLAMNKLVGMAYRKLTGGRGTHSSPKSGASKVSKQLAMAFAKRTLARCKKFEETGQSCFNEPIFHEVLSVLPLSSNAKCVESRNGSVGSTVSGSMLSVVVRNRVADKLDRGSSDPLRVFTHMPEQTIKPDLTSSKGKRREVPLDDVVTSTASGATLIFPQTLPGGIKGKRTERERDPNKESASYSSAKASRPASSNGRGERKARTKPKQKLAQLSTTGNGLLGRLTEATNPLLPEPINRANQGVGMPSSGNSALEDNILRNMPLNAIDSIEELDVAEGLGGHGQDIGSWLNFDEDTLRDHDLVGLEIPMDDLSDLKFSF